MKKAVMLSMGSALFLAGCAELSTVKSASKPRAGFAAVTDTTRRAIGKETIWLQSAAETEANAKRVHSLVNGKTINADRAVQVALLNNRDLQASYAELGMSSADLWETAMGPVPSVGISVSGMAGDVTRTLEATLISSLLEIATTKPRTKIAEVRFRQAQLAATGETLALANETRRAWIEAVAAFEAAALIRRAQETADTASELAAELGQTGAMNKADQAREHVFTAELAAERADALLEAKLAKEKLIRLMGLWGSDTNVFVPDSLPALPSRPQGRSKIERLALTNRVDLAAGRLELEAIAREYKLRGDTRMLSAAEIMAGGGIEREDGVNDKSPVLDVEFRIPVYDTGGLISRRGKLAYLRAANGLAQMAVDARSEARVAHAAVTGKHEVARHWRDQVLPLRKTINEESLLSYSGMLTSTFELITDARDGLESELGAAEAKRDYWLAETDVTAAIWGGSVDISLGEDE